MHPIAMKDTAHTKRKTCDDLKKGSLPNWQAALFYYPILSDYLVSNDIKDIIG